MNKAINGIYRVSLREIKRLYSRKTYLFCMVIAPLICTFFFLSLMKSGLPTNIPIALVDLDNTTTSRNLGRQLDAFEGTEIVMRLPSFSEARREMQKGNIYGFMLIPDNFQQEATSGKQPKLSFYTNNSFLIAGSLLFRDMKTISTLASASVALQTGRAKGATDAQIMAQVQPIVVDTHPLGNPWLNYSVYLNNLILPGILALLIMLVTVYSIGIEIKEGTGRSFLKTGNYSLTIGITGKLLPHTLVFFVVGLLIMFALYGVMHFPLNSGFISMMVALFLLILSSQALGVMMIGALPTLRLGLSFASIFGMVAFSISGFTFPATAMYPSVQALGYLFPLRHYYLIYVDQALNGRDFFYSWPQYVFLLLFLLLPFLVWKNLKTALFYDKYIP